jgi:hypothetical protein
MVQTLSRMAAAAVGAILVVGLVGANTAYGAQINAFLIPEYNEGYSKFMGLKFIQIKYPQGSSVASVFSGVNEKLEFKVQLSESQLEQVNRALLESNSPMQLASANVTYSGTIRGSHDTLTLAYNTELSALVSGYVLSQPSNDTAETILVDSNWRGFVLKGPLILDSDSGQVNVNEPIGLLQATFPEFAQKLMDANAETRTIMTQPILDFDDFGKMPLERWHLLFDPIPSQESVKGVLDTDIGMAKVLSVYSLGECSIREGCPEPREGDSNASIDGSDLMVHISTPQPNAQIEIAGYTSLETKPSNGNLEVIGVNLDQGTGGPLPFTMQVLLVLGGMMGAIAVIVLFKARK